MKTVFSLHAMNRILEYGLNYQKLSNNFKYARSVHPPKYTIKTNKKFHSGGGKWITYKYIDGILYTINTQYGKNIIMTVTPKSKESVVFEKNIIRPSETIKPKSRPKKVIYGLKKDK